MASTRNRKRGHVPRDVLYPPLSEEQILEWADQHHARTGQWPLCTDGAVVDAPRENWRALNTALQQGCRGLPGRTSLARLLKAHRGKRNPKDVPSLSIPQVLEWADAHHVRTGRWPLDTSGPILEAPGESWNAVASAFSVGERGLPKGSLPAVLAELRGVRHRHLGPALTPELILEWAEVHHARHGKWPTVYSGPVETAPAENWRLLNTALVQGRRGLPGGSSVAQLLAEHHGKRNHCRLPPFTTDEILEWARAFREKHDAWPTRHSGPIAAAPGETWAKVDSALYRGGRGLPGGTTLRSLFSSHE